MKRQLPFYECFCELERDVGVSILLGAAEAAALAVCGIGVETAIAVGMSTDHGYRNDHEFETDGALEATSSDDLSDLPAI